MKYNLNNKIISLNKKIINKFDYLKLLNETKNYVDKDDNNITKIDTDYKTFYGFILVVYYNNNKNKLLDYFDDDNFLKKCDIETLIKIILFNINKEKLKNIREKFLFNDYKSLLNTKFDYLIENEYSKLISNDKNPDINNYKILLNTKYDYLLKNKYSKISIKEYDEYNEQEYCKNFYIKKNKTKLFIDKILLSLLNKESTYYNLKGFKKEIKELNKILCLHNIKKKNKKYFKFGFIVNGMEKKDDIYYKFDLIELFEIEMLDSYFEYVSNDYFKFKIIYNNYHASKECQLKVMKEW